MVAPQVLGDCVVASPKLWEAASVQPPALLPKAVLGDALGDLPPAPPFCVVEEAVPYA